MPAIHTEYCFESAIESDLLQNGYVRRTKDDFDENLALFPADVTAWIKASQAQAWAKLIRLFPTEDEAQKQILHSLTQALKEQGSLYVLRHGFKCYAIKLRMAVFAPATTLNPETWNQYEANICAAARQIPCEPGTHDSIDTVLAVNGIPVVTLELKNPMTGQNVWNARRQYEQDRSPKAPLFRFKERALAHFAVDTEEVFLCTKLDGKDTYWLPFNQGNETGAGNPPAVGVDYRTGYLWKKVLCRSSLLELLARFIHLEKKEKRVQTTHGAKLVTRETVIFPRFHQLTSVRKLVAHAKSYGAGHNYLVQHSAGSGKSNTIGWLAHQLAGLHNADNERIFHSVVVVTDRVVIDRQLQDVIYQFEHKSGVVKKIDRDTTQLVDALAAGVPIIITTIQKFPFITQALKKLAGQGNALQFNTEGKRFAVIVDEAHSSQSGETATELRQVLNRDGIESAIAAQLLEDSEPEGEEKEVRANVLREMAARAKQPNLSYFAFTATPKFKTLTVFDEPGENGKAPFHLYSMRQAIEEGFILDVLAHYMPYKLYYELVQKTEDDPQVPKRRALRELARFVSLHPYNIRQKVEVIIEHFRNVIMGKIGGRAKAMVVTESRLHAVRYKLAVDAYLREKNYTDVRSLVAFSGSVYDQDLDKTFTEPEMNNGIQEKELPARFDTDEFNILLVADKYQTGFDQPLLHTMYVDKKLGGVQAVQTLSRLNRMAPGKADTFVLDFRNQGEEIYAAFKPYYEMTETGEQPDPQRLETLRTELFEDGTLIQEEIDAFCRIWFGRRMKAAESHQQINAILDKAVERFRTLNEDAQDLLRGKISAFVKLYTFMAQVLPYGDEDWEKLCAYCRLFLLKTVKQEIAFVLDADIILHYYRLQKLGAGKIGLDGDNMPLKGPTETGTGRGEEPESLLSELVKKLNDIFNTDFTKADQVFFEQVRETAVADRNLQMAAQANTQEGFSSVFADSLNSLLVRRMAGNEKIFERMMNDNHFRNVVYNYLFKDVYDHLNIKTSHEVNSL